MAPPRRRKQALHLSRTSLLSAAALVLTCACASRSLFVDQQHGLLGVPGHVSASLHRQRLSWEDMGQRMTLGVWERMMRVDTNLFSILLGILQPHLVRDAQKAQNSSGSVILPQTRLMVTLRWLAGGSYLDLAGHFGIDADSTFYQVTWDCVQAIIRCFMHEISFPAFDDEVELEKLAEGFMLAQPGKVEKALFRHIVGAIDGILIAIRKPTRKEHPTPELFFTRKGYHAINVQAMCDSSHKFTVVSCKTPGSTHDSIAWSLATFSEKIRALPDRFYAIADPAYVGCPRVVTGWKGRGLNERQNNFNYFLSSVRMRIECAFGILVARWGILWKPIRHSFKKAQAIVLCCMILHNLCIKHMRHTIVHPIISAGRSSVNQNDRPCFDPVTGAVVDMHNPNDDETGVYMVPTASTALTRDRIAYAIELCKMKRPKDAHSA